MSRFLVSPHEQRTPGWHMDRLGKLTGSKVAALYAKGAGKTRATLRRTLVSERLTGEPTKQSFTSDDMEWGNEQEAYSRMAFERETGLDVAQTGFLYLPKLATGCSVDGLVEEDGRLGIWESKSPKPHTHCAYILDGTLPEEYRPQVIHNIWITGAAFAWFSSYDPRWPGKLKTFHLRIEPSADEIQAHERMVLQFLMEADAEEKHMRLLIDDMDDDFPF